MRWFRRRGGARGKRMRRAAGTALCVIALAVMTCGLLSNASRAASEHGTRPTSRQILWDARSAPLDVLVGQMVMLGFRGTTFEQDSEIRRDIVQGHLGGVIFFDRDIQFPGRPRNIVSPRQTRAYRRDDARGGVHSSFCGGGSGRGACCG